jgi:hypothetical protein
MCLQEGWPVNIQRVSASEEPNLETKKNPRINALAVFKNHQRAFSYNRSQSCETVPLRMDFSVITNPWIARLIADVAVAGCYLQEGWAP